MASNTNNLGLLKKDPVADGNDTFNIRTMLNENWDKIDEFAGKTTPISKGGTGATTAAQALANLGGIAAGAVGNLHVWRKTVTTAQEIPAGYNLVPVDMKTTTFMYLGNNRSSSSSPELYYGGSATVNPDGSVSVSAVGKLRGQIGWNTTSDAVVMKLFPSDTTSSTAITSSSELQTLLRGKFVYFIENKNSWPAPSYLSSDKFYQIPSNATITFRSGYSTEGNPSVIISISSVNEVVGYPLTPARTTTDYLTSTDRNAYPDNVTDAQDAYYTLGDVVTGSFQMAEGYPSNNVFYETANSINVGADGAIILNSPTVASFTSDGFPDDASFLGKFIRFSHRGASGSTTPPATTPPFNTTPSEVVYIPTSATITHTNGIHAVDRYQPVTGYPAIPANNTITYLGQLGGGARIEVGSYVGTGTASADISVGFTPKAAIVSYSSSLEGTSDGSAFILPGLPNKTDFVTRAEIIEGGFRVYYNSSNQVSRSAALNISGFTYRYIAIG